MSSTVQRSPGSEAPERQFLFFRDLASPISSHRDSRFATPGQTAAVSALWRENFSTSDNPPPPPVFTLEDRIDFSPEPALHELPTSPESAPDPKTPSPARNYFATPSPIRTRAAEGSSGNMAVERSPASGSWWAPQRSEEKGKGSPVDGVANSGALIMLPPPREVARPEMKRNQLVPAMDGMLDEEEWVTVYGFSPGDTNLVLREFEKCGVILKHIPSPRDSNWMHILYQSTPESRRPLQDSPKIDSRTVERKVTWENRYDAQNALRKNGVQLNSVLIIGVKPVDPVQRQYLNERLNSNTHGGFMVSLPPQSPAVKSAALNPVAASTRPRYPQNGGTTTNDGGHLATGAIASPAKSVVSKVMDLMFGF